jgi:hypothetical protein
MTLSGITEMELTKAQDQLVMQGESLPVLYHAVKSNSDSKLDFFNIEALCEPSFGNHVYILSRQ